MPFLEILLILLILFVLNNISRIIGVFIKVYKKYKDNRTHNEYKKAYTSSYGDGGDYYTFLEKSEAGKFRHLKVLIDGYIEQNLTKMSMKPDSLGNIEIHSHDDLSLYNADFKFNVRVTNNLIYYYVTYGDNKYSFTSTFERLSDTYKLYFMKIPVAMNTFDSHKQGSYNHNYNHNYKNNNWESQFGNKSSSDTSEMDIVPDKTKEKLLKLHRMANGGSTNEKKIATDKIGNIVNSYKITKKVYNEWAKYEIKKAQKKR